ncbi:hypothetical protein ACOTHJ_14845 [Achromobacter xylosoxidans]
MAFVDNLKIPAMLAIIAALVGLGLWSDEIDELQEQELLAKYRQVPEFIQTTGFTVSDLVHRTTSGKFATTSVHWVFAESSDWVFLNGREGTNTCFSVLYDVERVNEITSAPLPQVLLWQAAFKEKPITIHALVPRFKQAPDLSRCPGLRYNEAESILQVGDKKIAYLLADQPRLAD